MDGTSGDDLYSDRSVKQTSIYLRRFISFSHSLLRLWLMFYSIRARSYRRKPHTAGATKSYVNAQPAPAVGTRTAALYCDTTRRALMYSVYSEVNTAVS